MAEHVVTLRRSGPIGEFLVYYYDSGCAPITGDFGYFDQPSIVPPAAAYAGMLLHGGGVVRHDGERDPVVRG